MQQRELHEFVFPAETSIEHAERVASQLASGALVMRVSKTEKELCVVVAGQAGARMDFSGSPVPVRSFDESKLFLFEGVHE